MFTQLNTTMITPPEVDLKIYLGTPPSQSTHYLDTPPSQSTHYGENSIKAKATGIFFKE